MSVRDNHASEWVNPARRPAGATDATWGCGHHAARGGLSHSQASRAAGQNTIRCSAHALPPAAQRTHGMAAGSGGQPPREPHSAQLVRARARLWPRDTGPVRQEARTPRRAHADVAPADGLLRPAGAGAAGKPAPAEWPRTTAPPAGIRDIMAAGPGASRARQQAIEEQPGAQPTSCPGFDDASQFHSWPPVGAHRRPRLRALSDRRAAAKWRWNHKAA